MSPRWKNGSSATLARLQRPRRAPRGPRRGLGETPRQGAGHEDKIAAIGVRLHRWVSFHGIAINVEPELSHFSAIVPCGVVDPRYGVDLALVDLEAAGRRWPISTSRSGKPFPEVFGGAPRAPRALRGATVSTRPARPAARDRARSTTGHDRLAAAR